MKVLVTGTRSYHDPQRIFNALSLWWDQQDEDITLVHGACPHPPAKLIGENMYSRKYADRTEWSVDMLANEFAQNAKWITKVVPADWNRCDDGCYHKPRKDASGVNYCPAAGPRRNKKMVDMLNPDKDVVLAFPYGKSAGTRGCIRLAEKAGLHVIVYELE